MIIDKDELLTQVTDYRYFRADDIVRIEIHEFIIYNW